MNETDTSSPVQKSDSELIAAVRAGDTAAFELLIVKYQPRIFGTARKYARRESEVEDIVQDIFIKAYQKLHTFRGDSPFEHWLMRLAVRTCYDALREHQRNREQTLADITDSEAEWLDRMPDLSTGDEHAVSAARALVHKILEQLPAPARLIIRLLEIEERSMKEVAELTGWSIPLIKVRAFRARQALKKCLARVEKEKYL